MNAREIAFAFITLYFQFFCRLDISQNKKMCVYVWENKTKIQGKKKNNNKTLDMSEDLGSSLSFVLNSELGLLIFIMIIVTAARTATYLDTMSQARSEHLAYVNLSESPEQPHSGYYYYFYFKDEETKGQRG